MAYQVGYWTELDSLKLDESSDTTTTFQAMPLGSYEHPIYGKIELTAEKVDEVVRNFNNKVRGTELDIDYDHKSKTAEAAGWVKAAEKRADGLWLTVEWTKEAFQKIKNKAYRYFSPEFADEWKHPKTGVVHKNVLFGGGITNRPFLKDILPLNMSELFEERDNQEGTGMDPKKLRKLLGLPEDATDEQVNDALGKLPEDFVIEVPKPEDKKTEDKKKEVEEPEGQQQSIAANEGVDAEVIKLAEKSPAIKALVESVTALQKTVETQGVALQLAETTNVVKKLAEPIEGRALPTSAQEKLQEVLLSAPRELSEKIVELVEGLNKTGYVQLGEHGESSRRGSGENEDATKKFNDAVQKCITDDKLSYGDAVERVASLNPELFEAHRQASYAFREN